MNKVDAAHLKEIAEIEFSDIVQDAIIPGVNELRIIFYEGSFLDVWYSLKLVGRYSYHWERRAIDGTIYRHDNAPHERWRSVSTFPHHFHRGSESEVVGSHIKENPPVALREFLRFIRGEINEDKTQAG